tara:strand:+ start:173 stop:550 length:378 start_codon:yes stop_codon:yes gene_type:complete
MSYLHALKTLQWSIDLEIEGHSDCLAFKASKDLIKKIKDDWDSFESQAIELGFDPEKHRVTYIDLSEGDYWAYAAHDFILTRNGHGAGFWDGDWSEPIATKLTELCKKFGEIEIYLSDENLLEVY